MRERFPSRGGSEGFTLIEIVVALAILGISLTVLFGIFSQAVARTHANEVREAERALAKSLLASAMSPDAPVVDSAGRGVGGLVWRVHFAPYGAAEDLQAWPQSVTEVSVTVAREDQSSGGVTLRTLRMLPKPEAQTQ